MGTENKTVKLLKKLGGGAVSIFKNTSEKRSLASRLAVVALLVLLGFVYVYPVLYMIAYSFMSEADVINPLVQYIPTKIVLTNYAEAIQTLDFFGSLLNTLFVSIIPALLQTVTTSLIAYALSRFSFKGKNILLACVLLTFIIPQQITMIPQVIIYTKFGIINSVLAYFVPALFGQGLRSAVFVLIFYQFFNQIPKSLEESAKIDGAGTFRVFWKIGVASAKPAYILSFLLSFVWYFNEVTLATLYLGAGYKTLLTQLQSFQSSYEALFGNLTTTGRSANEAVYMAGTLLCILPLILIYAVTQRYFVEGIDKAGITGE